MAFRNGVLDFDFHTDDGVPLRLYSSATFNSSDIPIANYLFRQVLAHSAGQWLRIGFAELTEAMKVPHTVANVDWIRNRIEAMTTVRLQSTDDIGRIKDFPVVTRCDFPAGESCVRLAVGAPAHALLSKLSTEREAMHAFLEPHISATGVGVYSNRPRGGAGVSSLAPW
ncbi:MAG: hypothetical protein LBR05_03645 [Azoarcus sp.]|jgi:hypothetical protein|nr:hypothetical protein [Azoarcus sp.]